MIFQLHFHYTHYKFLRIFLGFLLVSVTSIWTIVPHDLLKHFWVQVESPSCNTCIIKVLGKKCEYDDIMRENLDFTRYLGRDWGFFEFLSCFLVKRNDFWEFLSLGCYFSCFGIWCSCCPSWDCCYCVEFWSY